MPLITRLGAGLGTSALIFAIASPAMAQPTTPAAPKLPAGIVKSLDKLPMPPGPDATDAQIEAWLAQVSKAAGLPAFPGENATDAQLYAYVKAVAARLGLPAVPPMDASDAQINAWIATIARQFGLPTPPSVTASEAAWEAWFTKLAGPMMPTGGLPSHLPGHRAPGHSGATTMPKTPSGPVVQTDRVASSTSATSWRAGDAGGVAAGAAALLAVAAVTLVTRRRAMR